MLLFGISWLPVFQVQQIVVAGNDALSTEKVISISGLQVGDNLFWCDTGEAKKQLRHNPFVKKVSIRRDLPDTLIVQVTERPSVGYIVTSDGYVQVDAEGRMLAIQQSLSNYRLPVISGVGINELPELGGIQIEAGDNGVCQCERCKARRGAGSGTISAADMAGIYPDAVNTILRRKPDALVICEAYKHFNDEAYNMFRTETPDEDLQKLYKAAEML